MAGSPPDKILMEKAHGGVTWPHSGMCVDSCKDCTQIASDVGKAIHMNLLQLGSNLLH